MLVDRILGVGVGMSVAAATVALYMNLKTEVNGYVGLQHSISNAAMRGEDIDVQGLYETSGITLHNLTDEEVIELVSRLEDIGYFQTCEEQR